MARATSANAVRDLLDRYSGGRWVKLEGDGDLFEGAFVGEPLATEVIGWGKDTREVDNTDGHHDDARFQGYWNLVERTSGNVMMLKLNAKQVGQVMKDQKTSKTRFWYTIKKLVIGDRKEDVRYRMTKGDPISDRENREHQSMLIWDLADEAFGQGADAPTVPNPDGEDSPAQQAAPPPPPAAKSNGSAVIDDTTARKIWESFQNIPEKHRSKAWGELHTKLDIKDIKTLPASRLAEAKATFTALKNQYSAPPAAAEPPPPPSPPAPMAQDDFGADADPWGD